MAKKKSGARRVPTSQTPRPYGSSKPAARPSAAASKPSTPSTGTFASPTRTQVVRSEAQLSSEYHYVVTDLRRLGVLAAATFAVLVVLGLIIH